MERRLSRILISDSEEEGEEQMQEVKKNNNEGSKKERHIVTWSQEVPRSSSFLVYIIYNPDCPSVSVSFFC